MLQKISDFQGKKVIVCVTMEHIFLALFVESSIPQSPCIH